MNPTGLNTELNAYHVQFNVQNALQIMRTPPGMILLAPDGQNVIYSAAWAGTLHPELFTTRIDGVLSRPLNVGDC